MIRLLLVCACVVVSQTMHCHNSMLRIIKNSSKEMLAEVCVHHNYTIDCGWDMRLNFSGPLLHFLMGGVNARTRGSLLKSETQDFVVVSNRESNKELHSGTCQKFKAFFRSPVNASAALNRVCTDGRWTELSNGTGSDGYVCTDSGVSELASTLVAPSIFSTADGELQQCNPATCPHGDLQLNDWSYSLLGWSHGKICVTYGIPLTCIYDIGLTLPASVKALKVDGMRVFNVTKFANESLYKLIMERFGSIRANKTQCNTFFARHIPIAETINISVKYLDKCHLIHVPVSKTTTASTGTLPPEKVTTPTGLVTTTTEMITTNGQDFNGTFYVIDKGTWGTGRTGYICVDQQFPLSCGNDIEVSFSPPVLSLETQSVAILQENHTDNNSVFKLKSRIQKNSFPWYKNCFWFMVRHDFRLVSTNVTSVIVSQCNDSSTETTTATTTTTTATTASSSTTTQATTTTSARFFDYAESLKKSLTFYLNQRAGNISDNTLRRQHAYLPVLSDGRDLSGGLYDSADYVKFTFPMAATTTTLLWGLLQWEEGYSAAGQLETMYQLMKHCLDYLITCWNKDKNILYTQVGVRPDKYTWSQFGKVSLEQKVETKHASKGSISDLAAEMAATLAAGSIAFRDRDPAYASELLESAKKLYAFANEQRGSFKKEKIQTTSNFLSDGCDDELCWGAAWLLRATDEQTYLTLAKDAADRLNLTPYQNNVFSWNYKAIGCYLLMHNYKKTTKEDKIFYRTKIDEFLQVRNRKQSGCGLTIYLDRGNLRFTANSAMISLMAADSGINPDYNRAWAVNQTKYMLGANKDNYSYQVGFGLKYPQKPFYMGEICQDTSAVCAVKTNYIGALVGGPNSRDEYKDSDENIFSYEVAIDFNGGFQSSLAGLLQLQQQNKLPNVTPTCRKP